MPAPVRHSSAGRAVTLTMRPPPAASMAFTAARQHRKHETRLPSICAINVTLAVSATLPGAKPPAMWIEAQSFTPA